MTLDEGADGVFIALPGQLDQLVIAQVLAGNPMPNGGEMFFHGSRRAALNRATPLLSS